MRFILRTDPLQCRRIIVKMKRPRSFEACLNIDASLLQMRSNCVIAISSWVFAGSHRLECIFFQPEAGLPDDFLVIRLQLPRCGELLTHTQPQDFPASTRPVILNGGEVVVVFLTTGTIGSTVYRYILNWFASSKKHCPWDVCAFQSSKVQGGH